MKTVYKILPLSIYDIAGLEQWLEEQANHGLFPTRVGIYTAFTSKGVPGTRYRLEPWGNLGSEPDPEQLELYCNAGWEYAFSIARTFFLFYTTDPNAPELHWDLITHGRSLDRLARKVKKLKVQPFIILTIALLFILALLLWPAHKFDLQPDRWARLPLLLLHFTNPLFLVLLIAACFELSLALQDYRTLLNTYQALEAGLPPSPGPQKKPAVRSLVRLALIPILAISLLTNFIVGKSAPISEFELPYIPIAAIEDEPLFTHEELFGESNRYSEDENQGKRQLSLLSPHWYEVSQYLHSARPGAQANAFSPNPKDGKYRYSPSLRMTRFSITIPALSRYMAKSQLDVYRAINLYWTYEEVDYPGTDFVILAQADSGIWQMAALGNGKHVAVFSYGGQKKLVDYLDLLASMVKGP